MTLAEWVRQQGPGALTRLQKSTELAYTTIWKIARGQQTPRAETAKKIEAATDGAVTARELVGLGDVEDDAA